MDSCDVLIVGGGPGGSSCAWGLRHLGLDVVVLDKQVFPRDKVCGGWITPRVLTELEIDPAEYARQRMLQPISGFLVGCIGGPALQTAYGRPVSYGIRRCEFDDYLLKRSGARLMLGSALTTLDRSDGGWIANDRLRARVVVGAGGHFCPVARLLGAKVGAEAAVVAQEAEFQMDVHDLTACLIHQETPELYFCSDMTGYGWCFRKGDFLNVGLGRADSHRLSTHVSNFLEFLKASGRISFEITPLHGHAYLLAASSTRTVVGDGVLLVGDAAGLAHSQSGEGIRPAVESGLIAARNIAGANGTYNRLKLDRYRLYIASKRRSGIAKIGSFLPQPWISCLAHQLLRRHWFVRNVVLDQWFMPVE
jgi:geranylgeranyl reductase family protein